MTEGGWLVLVISVGTVTTLFLGCIYKVMSSPPAESEHLHGFDMETPDAQEEDSS